MTTLRYLGLALAITSMGSVGCGDDDRVGDDAGPDTSGVDVGPLLDGSVDTGTDDTGTDDTGTDTGTDTGGRGSMCPMTPCNPVTAMGCEAAGEGCYFGSLDGDMPPAPLCAPAGVGARGSACTNANDCQEGLVCLGGGAGGSTCQALCCARQNSDCPTGGTCIGRLMDEDTVMTCSFPDGCDLLAQTGCTGDDACYPMGSGDGATICSFPGDVAVGMPCAASNACVPGSACIGSGDAFFCRRICDVAMAGTDCDGEEACSIITGFADVGYCA